MTGHGLDCELRWLREFEQRVGRPLRVLHVGNIANNAYLNAKFLRSVGIEAHVLCHDYAHVMATPEWEDVELLRGHGDDFAPRLSRRDLQRYRRPPWFVSGPLLTCPAQIAALFGDRRRPGRAKQLLRERLARVTARLLGYRGSYALQLLV